MKRQRNIRFAWNGTKITLSPGQKLNHYQGGPTEEGYSWRAVEFTYDGTSVLANCASGGRDCDGPVEQYADLILINGKWECQRAHQRDHYAEAMGY